MFVVVVRRCTDEWKLAENLSHSCGVSIIVASMIPCPQPISLIKFLYLDFIDTEKREKVWKVLFTNVGMSATYT